ncbi:hypothetical protein [Aquipuribacter nitratireducens]|uniref:PH domain-containing protein n=1 Tax=Aquipuribacter nitratireducens TaxID=650104 RepID=A0ABW0GQZ9_9MICO
MVWRLSWWRGRGVRLVYIAVISGSAALHFDVVGERALALACLAGAGAALLASAWLGLVPGRLRLDAEGVRWGRGRRLAWVDVASFRLHDAVGLPAATTYLLPTTPDQEYWQEVGAWKRETVDVPAWVAGIPAWRVVALLEHYRREALRTRLPPDRPADGD